MSKYQVSQCIGRGGMAEVYLARQEGIGGFEKLVALKRIYPHLLHDESFIEMFLSEARIAASLRHPKIVQILDIENDDDGFFIVMEYLAGESVHQMLQLLDKRDERMPPLVVCRIGADVATGLHVAHISSDAEGHARPIIHRDMTPSNVLVSFNGEVKVLDFGVAKAATRKVTTEKGVLKGKTPYLTPEQIEGDDVDPRSDVFQLGIVLHEMLTGRPLFEGDTVPAIVKAITQTPIPAPSALRPDSPEQLDAVVLKALERNPDDRHQSAEELAHELDAVARQLGEPMSERELGKWMRATFPERDRQKRTIMKAARSQSRGDTSSDVFPRPATEEYPTTLEKPISTARPRTRRRRSKSRWAIGALLALAAAGLGIVLLTRDSSNETQPEPKKPRPAAAMQTPPDAQPAPTPRAVAVAPDASAPTYRVSITTVPTSARIELDGTHVASGEYSTIVSTPTVELRVSAPGHVPQRFTVSRAHPAPKVVRLERLKTTARPTAKAKRPSKPVKKRDRGPGKTKRPYGSDNLNPWD